MTIILIVDNDINMVEDKQKRNNNTSTYILQ